MYIIYIPRKLSHAGYRQFVRFNEQKHPKNHTAKSPQKSPNYRQSNVRQHYTILTF